MPWHLYVLRCADGSLYCGITNDLPRRLAQHERGTGARYTRGRSPLTLVKAWPAVSQSAALKAKHAFKQLPRPAKDQKLKSRARRDPISRLLRGERVE
jgi:putative endonuclease